MYNFNQFKLLENINPNDPYGEEIWDDKDNVFYSISTGVEGYSSDSSSTHVGGHFIVKIGKVYLTEIKEHYLKTNVRPGEESFKNLYNVRFAGGRFASINIYFKKISIQDLIKKMNFAYTGKPSEIRDIVRHKNFLIQEKCMNLDEIKKLADDIYNLESSNTIFKIEKQIKNREKEIEKMKIDIEKMKNNKFIEYKIDEIETIKSNRNINFG